MLRATHGSTVLYPCDANQTAKLVAEMANVKGISYLRTTREKTPVIYQPSDLFPIGGSKVLRRSEHDEVAIIAAGITLHEALKAYDQLQSQGIHARVIDAYSVKPIDKVTIVEAARASYGRVVVAEDHWSEGGLGDAVLEVLANEGLPKLNVMKLAVRTMPGSGKPEELLDAAGISTRSIVIAARALHGMFV
jgi:transketolase